MSNLQKLQELKAEPYGKIIVTIYCPIIVG